MNLYLIEDFEYEVIYIVNKEFFILNNKDYAILHKTMFYYDAIAFDEYYVDVGH